MSIKNLMKGCVMQKLLLILVMIIALIGNSFADVSISGPTTVTRGGVSPDNPVVDGYFNMSVGGNSPVVVGLLINPQTMTGDICDRPPFFMLNQKDFNPGFDQELYPIEDRTANFSELSPNGLDYPSAGCWDVPYNGLQYYGLVNNSTSLKVGTLHESKYGISSLKPGTYKYHVQKAEEPRNKTLDSADYTVEVTYGDVSIGLYDYEEWKNNNVNIPIDKITFGQKVHIAGSNTDSQDIYLWLVGKGLPICGSKIDIDSLPILNNDPTHFNQSILMGSSIGEYNLKDGSWYYNWDTSGLPLEEGEYTLYASSVNPSEILPLICAGSRCKTDICTGENGVCALTDCPICGPEPAIAKITIQKPNLDTFTVTQPEDRCCCPGYPCGSADYPVDIIISGYTETSNQSIQLWMFGNNQIYDRNYIFNDSFRSFLDQRGYFEINVYNHLLKPLNIKYCDLDPGDYYVVLQIPAVTRPGDEKYDVTLESSKNAQKFVNATFPGKIEPNKLFMVQSYPNMWTKIANVEGPGAIGGYEAFTLLKSTLDQNWVNDQYAVLKFTIRDRSGCGEGSVDFSGTPVSGYPPLNVQFTDISTFNGSSWYWDFGDGGTSNEKNPLHEFKKAGLFDVSLTVTKDGVPRVNKKYDFVVVTENTPQYYNPMADFTYAKVDNEPLALQFIDQSYGSTPLIYDWSFGDSQSSKEKSPKHIFPSVGPYTINLTVTDQFSKGNTSSKTITVPPVYSPAANFEFIFDEVNPLQVQFIDKSLGEITTWQWSFDDGLGSSIQSPIHLFDDFKKYNVTLTIGNSAGSNSIKKEVDIQNPTVKASFTSENLGDRLIRLMDTSTGQIERWDLEYGDGKVDTFTTSGWVTDHQYTQKGIYPARLTVSNSFRKNSYSERITVT